MTRLQKVALVLAAVVVVMSGAALIEGDFKSAALGAFLAASSVVMSFRLSPSKLLWRKRSN